jgi:hypothetical protein
MTALGADAVLRRVDSRAFRTAFVALVLATGFYEFYRYFAVWANSPAALERSKQSITEIGLYLNALPRETPRFVIVNDYGELDPADPGRPEKKVYTPAQTVIFLTYSHPKVNYVLVEELFTETFPQGSVIVPLAIDSRLFDALRERGVVFVEEPHEGFVAARVQ